MLDIIFNLLSFIFIISIIVFVHEFGHYIVAIYSGVKVEVFSIGIGPKILSWSDKRGTSWQVSALPIGGFVKMFGDSNAASETDLQLINSLSEEEKKHSFYNQKLLAKSLIVAAGPIANFLLAIVVFIPLFYFYGKSSVEPEISYIEQNSVADKSGLQIGDIILKINNKDIEDFTDVQKIVAINQGTNLNFIIDRDGKEYDIVIAPQFKDRIDHFGHKVKISSIGVGASKISYKRYGLLASVIKAIKETYNFTTLTLDSLWQMIKGKIGVEALGGPIKIAQYSGHSVKSGINSLIYFIALLSVNLGVINLFPIPVLDGGHLVFYILEALRGKPLADKVQKFSFRVGIALVSTLMVFSVFNDLRNLL